MILRAKVKLHVKFLLKEIGASFGVAQVLGGVATSFDLKGDSASMEGSAQRLDTLPMRVIQTLGDAHNRGQTAGDALVVAVQG